ncbi:ArsR/SmtB family transcription factor [Methylovorus sp. SPW-M1]
MSVAIDLPAMHQSAEAASRLMRILANADRLMLLCQLTQQELCVSELESMLDIRQPTLSQQLTVLREEELVTTRRDGKKIYYQIVPGPALAVMQVLYQQFCEAAG